MERKECKGNGDMWMMEAPTSASTGTVYSNFPVAGNCSLAPELLIQVGHKVSSLICPAHMPAARLSGSKQSGLVEKMKDYSLLQVYCRLPVQEPRNILCSYLYLSKMLRGTKVYTSSWDLEHWCTPLYKSKGMAVIALWNFGLRFVLFCKPFHLVLHHIWMGPISVLMQCVHACLKIIGFSFLSFLFFLRDREREATWA